MGKAHLFLIVCKPRPVVRVRIRRCVIRIRIGDTRIGVTVIVRPGENTTVETFRLSDAKISILIHRSSIFAFFYQQRFTLFRFFRLWFLKFYFTPEGKPRPVARARMRRCVTRIRIGDTRMGVTAIARPGENTTAC